MALLPFGNLNGQPEGFRWIRYFNRSLNAPFFKDVFYTVEGNLAAAGDIRTAIGDDRVRAPWLLLANDDGEQIWQHSYPYDRNSFDIYYSVIQCDDGGYLLGGEHQYDEHGVGYSTFQMIKTDSLGEILWRCDYGGRQFGGCWAVIELKSGEYVGAGRSETNAGNGGYIVVVNDSGAVIWDSTYSEDWFMAMREVPEEGIVLSGYNYDFTGFLLKINMSGEKIWSYEWNTGTYFKGLISCPEGGFAVCGNNYGFGTEAFYLLRVDDDGEEIWHKLYEFDDDNDEDFPTRQANSIARMPDGGFILVGFTDENSQPRILRTDADGNEMWHRVDDLSNLWDEYNSVIVTPDGDIIIAGHSDWSGLLACVPDYIPPLIVWVSPPAGDLSVLLGDSVTFCVSAQTWRPHPISILWTLDGDSVTTDSFTTITFPDLGDYLVQCNVSDGTSQDSAFWNIHVVELYIADWQPDTLNLLVQRNHEVDFSVTVRATPNPNPIEYQWLVDGAGVSDDTSVTVAFYESGDHIVEASANRNEVWDMVTWQVLVRSLIGWEKPDHRDTLTVNLGDTITFRIFPFNLDDTLNYLWTFDRRNAGHADSAVIVFGSVGLHQVVAAAWKGEEIDRIDWAVKVIDPRSIADFGVRNAEFGLSEPYPNPFNATAVVSYQLSVVSKVSLKLYDINGRVVQTLVDGWQGAGEHRALVDGGALPAGIYIIRLQAGETTFTRKAVVVK
jgi:hypothetical protein